MVGCNNQIKLSSPMDHFEFGTRYRRFLAVMDWVARLPLPLAYPLAERLALYLSPLLDSRDALKQSWCDAGVPFEAETLWRSRLVDHAVFCVNSLRRTAFDRAWSQQHVDVDMAPLAKGMKEGRGGLFLTYHHPFQHLLFCVLGLRGFRVQVLASPEESSPIHDQIGQYIHAMHRNCARHFNGGDYLFFSDGHVGARMAVKALKNADLLVSLNDMNQFNDKNRSYQPLCGRHLAIPLGSIRIACRLGVPIVAGIMIREGMRYRVDLRRLDASSPERAAAGYAEFLNEILAHTPAIWDGWDWFSSLSTSVES